MQRMQAIEAPIKNSWSFMLARTQLALMYFSLLDLLRAYYARVRASIYIYTSHQPVASSDGGRAAGDGAGGARRARDIGGPQSVLKADKLRGPVHTHRYIYILARTRA